MIFLFGNIYFTFLRNVVDNFMFFSYVCVATYTHAQLARLEFLAMFILYINSLIIINITTSNNTLYFS